MPELPPGWATDLAILRYTGSTLQDRGDHLLVRTPANPDFHWGHCLFVTDASTVDDAARWMRAFRSAFPEAGWVAIGLITMPADTQAWVAHGLELERDDVLTTRTVPRQTPLPGGYTVHRLDGQDWARSVARSVAQNDRTREDEPSAFERFATAHVLSRRALSERDTAAYFGAFEGDLLVAELGIVRCGETARYQSVSTDERHQ